LRPTAFEGTVSALLRRVLGNLELGATTMVIVADLVGLRALLWELGVEGMSPTALSAGIITGGVFVMGLVVAGTLSDYRDVERAPTEIVSGCTRSCERPSRCTPCGPPPIWRSCASV
jgi:hypothetical protein